MHATVSRQGTSRATTTTIDLCVLSTNSVPKLVCHAFCSHAPRLPTTPSLSWHSSCTFVVFLTRASTSIVQRAATGGVREGGRGSVEKFFSLVFPAHTQRKRYFIEFFVAQSESVPKIVVGTKFSISFSILVHLPATVATPPAPFPAAHLLCCWQVFLRTLLVFVGFA